MMDVNPLFGHASVLFVSALLFFTIVVRVVRYISRGKFKPSELLKDEMNSYLGFSGVTIFLALSIVFVWTGQIFFANLFFYSTLLVLFYFFYYTLRVLCYWTENRYISEKSFRRV